MTVNLLVQSDEGDVDGANAYIAVQDFQTYAGNRLYPISAYTTDQISAAIILGTDYVDQRFTYRGVQRQSVANPPALQTTQWPRAAAQADTWQWWDIEFNLQSIGGGFGGPVTSEGPMNFIPLADANGRPINGIPQAVKNATSEYAFRVLLQAGTGTGNSLFQDAPAPVGGLLQRSVKVQVDVISQEVVNEPRQPGAYALPVYPPADLWLARAGLIVTGRVLFR